MNFTVEHHLKSGQIGQNFDIELSLDEQDSRAIECVEVFLDGNHMNRPQGLRHSALRRYRKEFQEVGEFIPGQKHQLVLRVTLSDGSQTSSTAYWRDSQRAAPCDSAQEATRYANSLN